MARIVEVEEDGTLTLPAELLGDAKPHTRYIVEEKGAALILQPEEPKTKPLQKRAKAKTASWEKEREALTARLGEVWPKNLSVVEVVSEMRR